MFEELFYQRLAQLRAEKGVSARDMSLSLGQRAGYINALDDTKVQNIRAIVKGLKHG